MAVDTRAKRQSAHNAAGGTGLPNADGTVGQEDRQHVLGYYGGIAADAAVATVSSGPFDNVFRRLAVTLTGAFGGTVTVNFKTGGAYAPATGLVAQSNSDSSVDGVLSFYGTEEFGSLVKRGDIKLLVPARDIDEPNPDDTVTIDSVVYQVVSVRGYKASALMALYEVQLRR